MTITNWSEVERSIRRRGRCDLAIRDLESQLNRELDAVRARYARRLAALADTVREIDEALESYAAAHRDEMGRASDAGGLVWRCLFGKIAFRKLPPKIKFLKTVEKVLAALKAARLTECIRTIEEPNKEVLLALDDATLKTVHVKAVGGEQFEVVPDYEEITKEARR
jgi:phage host-nuclease inhibitor protein Gam